MMGPSDGVPPRGGEGVPGSPSTAPVLHGSDRGPRGDPLSGGGGGGADDAEGWCRGTSAWLQPAPVAWHPGQPPSVGPAGSAVPPAEEPAATTASPRQPMPGESVPLAAPAAIPFGQWRFSAPAVIASVPEARHTVRDLLVANGVDRRSEALDGLLLIVSELVTNAVKHAAVLSPHLLIEVTIGQGQARVAVQDDHPYRPKALHAGHTETGGRGLLLVKTITAELGGTCDVERTAGGGKVIWASLPL